MTPTESMTITASADPDCMSTPTTTTRSAAVAGPRRDAGDSRGAGAPTGPDAGGAGAGDAGLAAPGTGADPLEESEMGFTR